MSDEVDRLRQALEHIASRWYQARRTLIGERAIIWEEVLEGYRALDAEATQLEQKYGIRIERKEPAW